MTARPKPIQLTWPQYRVVLGLLEGKPNKTIAREMDISIRTVEYHRAAIYAKADVTSPVQLGVELERRGYQPARPTLKLI